MLAQQAIPASKDARDAPPMAPDADIPFAPWAHLAALNAFYRRRRALKATLAGRPVTMATTSPTRGSDDVTDRYVVDLKIDAAEGEICVPQRLLDALVATVDPTLSLDRLGAGCKATVIEFVLSKVFAAVETGVGCRLSLVAIHPERLGRANGERVPLALQIGFDAACCDNRGGRDRAAGTRRCHARRSRMSAGQCGDSRHRRAFCHPCRVEPGRHRGHGAPSTRPWFFLGVSMGNPTEFSGPTGLHDSDLDDLPVRLVFELGRVELSLGELQRLAPGALVPLARPLDEPIDIMANGRRLGRGTLVQIGESLGVRIVSLVGNE